MDSSAALRELRALVATYLEGSDDARRAAELLDALDKPACAPAAQLPSMPDDQARAIRALKHRIITEHKGSYGRLINSLRYLEQEIGSAQRALAEGKPVNAHLISNASMLTEEIARWNLARDLLPFVQDDSA